MIQVLIFTAGDGRFGVDLPRVANIRKAEADSGDRVQAPRLADLLDLSLGLSLGLSGGAGDAGADQVVTLTGDHGDLSLRVDRIDGVANAHEGEILPLSPVYGERARRFVPRVLLAEAGPVLMLDPEALAGIAGDHHPGPDRLPEAETESAPPPAEMSDAELEDRLLKLILSEPMTRRIETMLHRLSEKTAEQSRYRIKRAMKRT